MRARHRLAIVCLVLPAILPAGTGAAEPTFVDVADGIFAALQPHAARFDDANVVVAIGESAVLVVDAPTDAGFIAAVIGEIESRTEMPVTYLVNTHWHGDHTQGNAVWLDAFPELTVVGHESLAKSVPERAAADHAERVESYDEMLPQARENLAKGLGLKGQELDEAGRERQAAAIEQGQAWLDANRELAFHAPALTYGDRLVLDLGGFEAELTHRRAHTDGDTVVWFPARKLLVTGDLLDDLPYVGHGYPRSWIATLDELAELPFERIVPGHGPVFEDREKLTTVRGFLAALVADADGGARLDVERWRKGLAGDDAGAQRFFDAVLEEARGRAREEPGD